MHNSLFPHPHIDDVAQCHILVYEHEAAHGRYICSSDVVDNNQLVSLLSARYPSLPIPYYDFDTSKIKSLGFKFRPIEDMFDDCVTSLVEQGYLILNTNYSISCPYFDAQIIEFDDVD